MEQLLQQIELYRKEIETYATTDKQAAENFRIKYLGSKGLVKSLMAEMKNVPADKKKEFGQILNDFKQFAEEKFEALKKLTADSRLTTHDSRLDLTLPGDPILPGSRHPITLMRNKIVSIFQRLGFSCRRT
jgi:phenylalanyl-tRNA synthetase alpha chain